MEDPALIAIVAVTALLVLLALGVYIGFALFAVGLVGLALMKSPSIAFTMLGTIPYTSTGEFTLAVIPLFIIMGHFAVSGGLAAKAYAVGYTLLGSTKAGLALASMLSCSMFAAATGSSAATAATIGSVAIPEMEKRGYDTGFACGAVAAGGTLGVLIPPSVVLVVYGMISGESIGQLLVAGFTPGIMMALAYGATILLLASIRPEVAPPGPPTTKREKVRALGGIWGFALLIFVILGGLYTGWGTPTEIAALGALAAFIMAMPMYLRDRSALWTALRETVITTSMIFIIIAGAKFFTIFISVAGIPGYITGLIIDSGLHPLMVLTLFYLMYIVMGMFLEPISVMLISVPLAYPVVTALGYDGLWFGIIVCILIETSYLTPPLGFNVFVINGIVPHVSVGTIFKNSIVYVFTCILIIAILTISPNIVTFLPSLMSR